MFCEDVYILMQKILPTKSFGMLILSNGKIYHVNNNFTVKALDVTEEQFDK